MIIPENFSFIQQGGRPRIDRDQQMVDIHAALQGGPVILTRLERQLFFKWAKSQGLKVQGTQTPNKNEVAVWLEGTPLTRE